MCDHNNIGGYLVTLDIEKAFELFYYKFIHVVLKKKKKKSFGKNFVSWVEILLNNQESYVINGGKTT